MKVVEARNDVRFQKIRGAMKSSHVISSTVKGKTSNCFNDNGSSLLTFFASKFLKKLTFNADILDGTSSFHYVTLIVVLESQAIECYHNSIFSARGWLMREMKITNKEIYVKFLRYRDIFEKFFR